MEVRTGTTCGGQSGGGGTWGAENVLQPSGGPLHDESTL